MSVCKICSIEFKKRAWNQIYCSKKCGRTSELLQLEKKCPSCGIDFMTARKGTNSRKYCSRKCMSDSYSIKITKESLHDYYINKRLTTREIAKMYNTSKTSIVRALKRFDIPTRTTVESMKHEGYEKLTKNELYNLYWVEWLSYEEIAEKLDVSASSIYLWMKEYGIETRVNAETRLGKDFVEPTEEELKDMYITQRMNLSEMSEVLGCGEGVISRRLVDAGIEVRSNIFGNAGYKVCTNGLKVRSNYERYFANLLLINNIEFEYEPRLPFDKRFATDFLVSDVYVEIWGVENNQKYTERRIRKTELYNKHGLKLLEIYPKDFKNINEKIDKLKRLIS